MQDEQYKKRAGKLTYIHNVKLLRNAGDLPSVQTGHRRGAQRQEQERPGNKSEEGSENTTRLQRTRHARKSLSSSSFRKHFEIWL
jgi:hypothetical protein